MTQEAKVIIGIGLATLAIIFGGVFLFAKNDVSEAPLADQKVVLGDKTHANGELNAKVILVEFADFQCPACAAAHPVMKQVLKSYSKDMVFFYRHFPLPAHKNAKLAAKASEAASIQGKFWEMYDILYGKQDEWSESNDAKTIFISYAEGLNMDVDSFTKTLESSQFGSLIAKDQADGVSLGVNSTPTFFLNGKKLAMSSFADLPKIIDEEIKNIRVER